MSLENCFDAREPVSDLDYFAFEGIETCLKARETVLEAAKSGIHSYLEARESRVHASLEACTPRTRRVVLQDPGEFIIIANTLQERLTADVRYNSIFKG